VFDHVLSLYIYVYIYIYVRRYVCTDRDWTTHIYAYVIFLYICMLAPVLTGWAAACLQLSFYMCKYVCIDSQI